MAEAPLKLDIGYFPDPAAGKPIGLGMIYVGVADTDPAVLANRISVVAIQEDGTRVTIPPASQPLVTGSGGVVMYDGSPVVVLVDGVHSVKVLDNLGATKYYNPYVNESAEVQANEGVRPINGSFEFDTQTTDQPDNWSVVAGTNGTVELDTDSAHGLKSLKFTGTDATGGGVATSDKFDVLAGSEQVIKFTYKSSAVDTRNKVDINWYDASDSLVSSSSVMDEGAANPLVYTTVEENVTVPATGVRGEIVITGIDGTGTTVNGSARFDGFQLKDTAINRVLTMIDTPVSIYLNNTPPTTTEESVGDAILTNAGAIAALVSWDINCVTNGAIGYARSATGVAASTQYKKLEGRTAGNTTPHQDFTIGLDGSQQFYIMHSGSGSRPSRIYLCGYWS